jgi:galactose-1-phosphate uridylyltransferase
VLSSKHYIRLDEFSHRVFIDALNASLEFVKRVHQVRPECKYAVMGVNYLPPASSSVVHPHLQLYLSHIPFHYLDRVLRLSEEYRKKNSGNYWDELVAVERQKGERYVGRARNTEWLASFAPMGFNEVQGIICNKSNFLEFDEADIEGISQGLSNVLRCYGEKMKLASFNVALVSGPLGEERDDFCANLRVISRPNLRSNYVSDGWFGEKLLLEGWSPFFPEDIAALLKGYFGP